MRTWFTLFAVVVACTMPPEIAVASTGASGGAAVPVTKKRDLDRAVAERVAAAVARVGNDGPLVVKAEGEDLDDVAKALERAWAGDGGRDVDADPVVVSLRWRDRTTRHLPWWPEPVLRGTVVADVCGPRGAAVVTVAIDEKPWLAPGAEARVAAGYVVARSPGIAVTEAEARESARVAAVDALVPRIRHGTITRAGGGVPDDLLREQAEAAVRGGRAIADESAQGDDRSYGPVWTAGLVLRVDDDTITEHARAVAAAAELRRVSRFRMTVLITGLAAALALLYAVTNAMTRGYFRPALRRAAVGAATVGVVVILFLAR